MSHSLSPSEGLDAATVRARATPCAGREPVCPYCGSGPGEGPQCPACAGLLDPLSRQASQNAMGPWFIRDENAPFRPGCSYETLVGLIKRGRVTRATILRGPTTRQFWMRATDTPGVAHLLGECHGCHARVRAETRACDACGSRFDQAPTERQHLGLAPVRVLPGQGDASQLIASAMSPGSAPARAMVPVGASPSHPPADERPSGDGCDGLELLAISLRARLRRQSRVILALVIVCILLSAILLGVLAFS